MFLILAVVLAIGFVSLIVLLPFRPSRMTDWVLGRAESLLVGNRAQVLFYRDDSGRPAVLFWFRLWAAAAAAALVGAAVLFGFLLNKPIFADTLSAFLRTAGSVAAAAAAATFVTWGVFSFTAGLGMVRTRCALKANGYQGSWLIEKGVATKELRDALAAHLAETSSVKILDVTGFGVLGKGAGPGGALLYDLLDNATNLPVSLLLLHPESTDRDAEFRSLSVIQSTISDMQIPMETFKKRMSATLRAVAGLNEGRAIEDALDVRFYGERPQFKAILFDDAVFVCPWSPTEEEEVYHLFRSAGPNVPSLFEIFRGHIARLWGLSVAIPPSFATSASRAARRRTARTPKITDEAQPAPHGPAREKSQKGAQGARANRGNGDFVSRKNLGSSGKRLGTGERIQSARQV